MRFQSIKTELNRTVHPKPNRTKPLKKLELEPNQTVQLWFHGSITDRNHHPVAIHLNILLPSVLAMGENKLTTYSSPLRYLQPLGGE